MNNNTNAMPSSTAVTSIPIRYLVFREVLPGDVKKFKAKANDAKTGGGARDFRFSPYDKFEGIFERIFSGTATKNRRRGGLQKSETIFTVQIHLPGNTATKQLEFEPPTDARQGEGRLTRLNQLGLSVPVGAGRVFLLIYQTSDNQVWLAFATQDQLTNHQWHETVNDFLLTCMLAKRPANNAAQGFLNVETGNHFCKK